jgi:predicted nucleic acid-binding protein
MTKGEKIVVDASAVLAVILNEPEKAKIIAQTQSCSLISPGCLKWEIGNAFTAMLKRKRLTLEEATRGLEIYAMIPIQEMDVSLLEAVQLSERHNIYAYDAYYLELAKRNTSPLLTLDGRMAQVANDEGIKQKVIL